MIAATQKHVDTVRTIMRRSGWVTIRDLQNRLMSKGVYVEPQTVSARIRDLRKPQFGGHEVERRHAGDGIYEYRIGKGAA